MLIATTNKGKIKEMKELLQGYGIEVKSLLDFPNLPDVEETADTFEGNARLKAETIAQLTGEIVLADDSGLEVAALNKAPGVYSARYAYLKSGKEEDNHNEEANNQVLLKELSDKEDKSASYVTVLCLAFPDRESLIFKGKMYGNIIEEPRGENGFAYDKHFEVGTKTVAEMTVSEKNLISQRGNALRKLMTLLANNPELLKF